MEEAMNPALATVAIPSHSLRIKAVLRQ